MRTKELKPGVKYATEAGTCVETGETVERGWYRYRETGKGIKERQFIRKGLPGDNTPEADPWSGGTRRASTIYLDGRVLRDIVEGVRVTVHKVDGEGNSTESFESVVDPKIIKGTWADYVKLHGDVLRSEQYKREAEEAAKAESIRLNDLAKSAGVAGEDLKVSVSVMYIVDDKRRSGDLTETGWLGRGQKARGFRLEPSLQASGPKVEQLLFSAMSDGH